MAASAVEKATKQQTETLKKQGAPVPPPAGLVATAAPQQEPTPPAPEPVPAPVEAPVAVETAAPVENVNNILPLRAIGGFLIESGIEMPEAPTKYPFGFMNVGESFAIPVADEDEADKIKQRLSGVIQNYKKKHPAKTFAVRKVKQGQTLVVRVWRIADRLEEVE